MRLPDLNPAENLFHIDNKQPEEEAMRLQITKESFEAFRDRVIRCLNNIDADIIDQTINSMPKRIKTIISGKGIRLKF